MEFDGPISRKLRVLVGRVAKKELAAGVNQIAAQLPIVGDGIVGVYFHPVLGHARKLVAGPHLDVARRIGKGIIGRAQGEGALKGGVYETVVDANLPFVVAIANARLDALTPGIADVLEKAGADDGAGN